MMKIICIIILSFCINGVKAQFPIFDSLKIISSENNSVKLISDQFSFTEGPVAGKKGIFYFTDQPNDKIWKYNASKNKLKLFVAGTGRANGLYLNKRGNIVACADEKGELRKFSEKGKSTVVLNNIGGKRMNGPNDLWIDEVGGIYFTDPFYKRDYWSHSEMQIDGEYVYYLAPGAGKPVVVISDFVKPNGIIGSADGKYLFATDIGDWKTYRFNIEENGYLSNKILFAPIGSDGLTLDEKGNLYLTGNGVLVYDSSGNKIAHIPVPADWTSNVTFGGKKKDILFITAGKGIYTLKMNLKG